MSYEGEMLKKLKMPSKQEVERALIEIRLEARAFRQAVIESYDFMYSIWDEIKEEEEL